MDESVRLGTIAGVRVGINWSVIAIFALIALSLGAGRFPLEYPGRSTATYAIVGLLAAVVFFLSLLAHEVAHAVVARREGLEVDGITLWLFGGVARLGGEAASPGADFRIAGIGPLVSLVLAAGFFALRFALEAVGAGGVALGALRWLAIINLALAGFNLVPAAPLDGGRLLRAWLWRRRGDRTSATVTASRAGVLFGSVLIALGIVEFAFGAGLGGLWFALIGWFLINAARGEEQYARVQNQLAGVRVRDVMSPHPTTASADLTVAEFIDRYVFAHRYATFPLTDGVGRPEGLISLNRIREVPASQRGSTRVSDVACPMDEVATAAPDDALADVLPRMGGSADGRVLVLSGGQLVGIVSPKDVARVVQYADLRDARDASHV